MTSLGARSLRPVTQPPQRRRREFRGRLLVGRLSLPSSWGGEIKRSTSPKWSVSVYMPRGACMLPSCSVATTPGTHHFCGSGRRSRRTTNPTVHRSRKHGCACSCCTWTPRSLRGLAATLLAFRPFRMPDQRLDIRQGRWRPYPAEPIEVGEPHVALTPRTRAAWALVAAPCGGLVWSTGNRPQGARGHYIPLIIHFSVLDSAAGLRPGKEQA